MTFPLSDKYRIPVRALAAAVMLTALQGCVAAVVPIIAGGAALKEKVVDKGKTEPAPTEAISQTDTLDGVDSIQPAPAAERRSLAEIAKSEISDQVATNEALTSAAADQADSTLKPTDVENQTPLGPVPSVFADLTAYVLDVVSKNQSPKASQSALLIDPSRLDARRTKCEAFGTGAKRPPAVLIDLDDKNGIFDPTAIAPTYDGDAYGHLSRLREAGVTIGWMSALTAADAGGIRKALQASGLDVEGEDELVLFRYPEDRKQTRRSEFGAAHCLIAIAGDDRADFDELYQYLLNPGSAASLEPLIGNGWFLLPTGLSMRSAKQDPPAQDESNEVSEVAAVTADQDEQVEPEAELPPLN